MHAPHKGSGNEDEAYYQQDTHPKFRHVFMIADFYLKLLMVCGFQLAAIFA